MAVQLNDYQKNTGIGHRLQCRHSTCYRSCGIGDMDNFSQKQIMNVLMEAGSNDGYAGRYAALESRMDSLEKERERKEIQHDIFSGFLAGPSETEELSVDINEKLFHRLVDYATVYPDGRVVFTIRNGAEVGTKI